MPFVFLEVKIAVKTVVVVVVVIIRILVGSSMARDRLGNGQIYVPRRRQRRWRRERTCRRCPRGSHRVGFQGILPALLGGGAWHRSTTLVPDHSRVLSVAAIVFDATVIVFHAPVVVPPEMVVAPGIESIVRTTPFVPSIKGIVIVGTWMMMSPGRFRRPVRAIVVVGPPVPRPVRVPYWRRMAMRGFGESGSTAIRRPGRRRLSQVVRRPPSTRGPRVVVRSPSPALPLDLIALSSVGATVGNPTRRIITSETVPVNGCSGIALVPFIVLVVVVVAAMVGAAVRALPRAEGGVVPWVRRRWFRPLVPCLLTGGAGGTPISVAGSVGVTVVGTGVGLPEDETPPTAGGQEGRQPVRIVGGRLRHDDEAPLSSSAASWQNHKKNRLGAFFLAEEDEGYTNDQVRSSRSVQEVLYYCDDE